MDARERACRIVALLIALGGGVPGGAAAQSGFSMTPSVSAAEVYDDNIFASPSRPQPDRIGRLSPAIEMGYDSAPWTLAGRYSQDAETYAEHPDLDTNRARQHAALDWRYRPTRVLTVSAGADYAATQTPSELNPVTGLNLGRAPAERLSVGPAVEYRFDPVSVATASYTFIGDRLAGGVAGDTRTVELRVDRAITRRDSATVDYLYRRFDFDGGDITSAHVLLFGGTHAFTSRTRVALLAGPRWSQASNDVEASASLQQTIERGTLALEYGRSQSTVIGQAGVVSTDAIGASAVRAFGTALEIRAGARAARSARGDGEVDAYSYRVAASYRISSLLALTGSYDAVRQRGTLDVPSDTQIVHHVLAFGVVVGAPARAELSPGRARWRTTEAPGEDELP
ncbi:MAG: hypothetical protein ACJ8KA_01240 [Sulfurifustis sp.]